MNQKRPVSLEGHTEAREDIKTLTESLVKAYRSCEEMADLSEKEEIKSILSSLQEDFEGYFAEYVDRRNSRRSGCIFEDMLAFYSLNN